VSNLPARREPRGLYKDPEKGKIGGVCSGLARWTGVPAVFWRLGLVVAFLGWGVGLVLYALLWFLMDNPPEPAKKQLNPADLDADEREIWDAVKKDMRSLDLEND